MYRRVRAQPTTTNTTSTTTTRTDEHDVNVRVLCKRLARRARIEKRVHPHAFRHTHAAELAHDGLPMNLIQAQLGHSSLATTSRYLAHIAPAELVKAMQARTWSL